MFHTYQMHNSLQSGYLRSIPVNDMQAATAFRIPNFFFQIVNNFRNRAPMWEAQEELGGSPPLT